VRATALLRNVSVFSGLPDELLERLAAQVGEVHVRAGEWIMREGDAAQSLFVVCSGRLV
jgi:CRP-like cAMP-binding protein